MVFASWVALLGGGVLAGLGPVVVMAWPRRYERLAAAATLLAAGLSAAGLVGISILAQRIDEAVVAGFLGVAAAVGGFALGGALLAQAGAETPPARLPDPVPPAAPGIAVLLLCEAEPAEYAPADVAGELRRLADSGVDLPPETMRPFIFASEKARYRSLGHSPERESCRRLAASLAERLDRPRFTGVSLAWSDRPPLLDDAVAAAVGEGRREIVVCALTVGDDLELTRARHRADALHAGSAGVTLRYTRPLWSSVALAEHIAGRVRTACDAALPGEVGVALVGHGQPAELQERDPLRTEQETYFHQRIRSLLVEHGFDEARVRLGWAQWQEPAVTEVVRHLAALGCPRVLVVPASMPGESLMTLLDIPEAVTQARVERASDVVVLPAWGDDPVVADALAESVRETAGEQAD